MRCFGHGEAVAQDGVVARVGGEPVGAGGGRRSDARVSGPGGHEVRWAVGATAGHERTARGDRGASTGSCAGADGTRGEVRGAACSRACRQVRRTDDEALSGTRERRIHVAAPHCGVGGPGCRGIGVRIDRDAEAEGARGQDGDSAGSVVFRGGRGVRVRQRRETARGREEAGYDEGRDLVVCQSTRVQSLDQTVLPTITTSASIPKPPFQYR